jgi:hypothetical protein
MRFRRAIIACLAVLALVAPLTAHAVDDRVFYYSKTDVINSADWSYHPDDGLSITFTYN